MPGTAGDEKLTDRVLTDRHDAIEPLGRHPTWLSRVENWLPCEAFVQVFRAKAGEPINDSAGCQHGASAMANILCSAMNGR